VSRVSGVTDHLVICTAESERQVLAVKDQVEKVLEQKGHRLYGLEGMEAGVWVLMDYGDFIIHIFKRSVREHFGLDRLWNDAKCVPLTTARSSAPATGSRQRARKERALRQRG